MDRNSDFLVIALKSPKRVTSGKLSLINVLGRFAKEMSDMLQSIEKTQAMYYYIKWCVLFM
jgi:hypothetical protein